MTEVMRVPAEVTRVEGCDCGGLAFHSIVCTVWDLDAEQRAANVYAAEDRLKAHVDALNERLP